MKYRDRTTGQIYGVYDIIQKYPNTSFPLIWDASTLDYINMDSILEVGAPGCHALNRVECSIQSVDNQWTEVWTELPFYDDPKQQEQYRLDYYANLSAELHDKVVSRQNEAKEQRNLLLQQTDYTQLSDTPITDECRTAFVVYRQTLRDMELGNPYDIQWPTTPQYIKRT